MTTPDPGARLRVIELRLRRADKFLDVAFADGAKFELPAELLRVESPSAEIKGHGGPKRIVGGRRHVGFLGLEPVGHYAIRIQFDDTHNTGLYTWAYLREMGERKAELWDAYLKALADFGLSRDP